jgi:hypothetical protein
MAGESDNEVDGTVSQGFAEVMQSAGAHDRATGTMGTARAGSCRPAAAVPLETRPGQVFDTSDVLGDLRNRLPWTSHRLLS